MLWLHWCKFLLISSTPLSPVPCPCFYQLKSSCTIIIPLYYFLYNVWFKLSHPPIRIPNCCMYMDRPVFFSSKIETLGNQNENVFQANINSCPELLTLLFLSQPCVMSFIMLWLPCINWPRVSRLSSVCVIAVQLPLICQLFTHPHYHVDASHLNKLTPALVKHQTNCRFTSRSTTPRTFHAYLGVNEMPSSH